MKEHTEQMDHDDRKQRQSFPAIDEALQRQPLLTLAYSVSNEIRAKIAELQTEITTNGAGLTAKAQVLEGVLLKMEHILNYLVKDCVSGLDVRSRQNTQGVVEFYEPANEVIVSMWRRILIELLVEMKLFQCTNEEAYYRHYVLLSEMNRVVKKDDDLQEFFSCRSSVWQGMSAILDAELTVAEEAIDLSRAWYGKREKSERRAPKAKMVSHRQKFRKALRALSDMEKQLVGMTYFAGYSNASEDIHAGVSDPFLRHKNTRPEPFEAAIQSLALFCLHIYDNVVELLRVDTNEMWVDRLKQIIHVNDGQDEERIRQIAWRPEIEIGDFVLVGGRLGQVKTIQVSPYSYRSFQVRFLDIGRVPVEDCIPPFNLRLFQKLTVIRQGVQAKMKESPLKEISLENRLSSEELDECAVKAVTQIYNELRVHLTATTFEGVASNDNERSD